MREVTTTAIYGIAVTRKLDLYQTWKTGFLLRSGARAIQGLGALPHQHPDVNNVNNKLEYPLHLSNEGDRFWTR